ncbi:MAG: RNA polymerase sigma factor, partial [Lachnospiraceae bacterium]
DMGKEEIVDDFLLILRMKQGNEDAFEKFVRKYYSQILQYCRYHCFDMEHAEDLTQETFLKFISSLQSYHHMGKAKNYLYTIAGNLCKNNAKKKKDIPVDQDVLEQEIGFSNVMERTETKICIEQALDELLPELREIIILFYFQDCKIAKIADILQISLPLVKYRLRRAKEELKRLLGKEENYGAGERTSDV